MIAFFKKLWLRFYGERYILYYNGYIYTPKISRISKYYIKWLFGYYPAKIKIIIKHSIFGHPVEYVYYKVIK